MPSLTVATVVPTLDEESTLAGSLPLALAQSDQVIVSDGGSRDGTVRLARELGAEVACGPPGRGVQLNRGAARATTDALLFLHADTLLPDGAVDGIRAALSGACPGGGFRVRFDSPRPVFGLGARLVNLRTGLTRCPLGDQAQFCRRRDFLEMGGFADWPILEDLDFIRRLKRRGPLAILSPAVRTSARRFENRGIARTLVTNWLIFTLYFFGVAPPRLARLYRRRGTKRGTGTNLSRPGM